jgi:putative Mg2+ transporter-C (MgtC) family protein
VPADLDIFLRLVGAVAAGCLLGINRDLAGENAGVRTLGMVALVAGLAGALASFSDDPANRGRALQGVLTGVGFVGAGLILHTERSLHVKGLATAATVLLAAILGFAAGSGMWGVTGAGLFLGLLLLLVGKPIDLAFRGRSLTRPGATDDRQDGDA